MKIHVAGYCALSAGEIQSRIIAGISLQELAKLAGNFVISAKDAERDVVIISEGFAGQYFNAATSEGFFHGPTVSGVLRESGLPHSWNFRAMADYLSLGHVIGNQTLIRGVERIPQGTIAERKNGTVKFSKTERKQEEERAAGTVQGAIDALCSDVVRWWTRKSVLCITGGFDSRLLLAVLLSQNIKPDLFVAGQTGSYDVEIADTIARKFGLSLCRGEVVAEDFLDNADTLAWATSGMLPMSHWPGVLLAAEAPQATLFLGLNGEYARSYYFDSGMMSLAVDRLTLASVRRLIFQSRLRFPGAPSDLCHLHPELALEFSTPTLDVRLRQIFENTRPLGANLDEVYRKNYGGNKTGADLSAIGAFRSFVVPFFSPDWIDAIRNLPRYRKLDSNFHRYAIHKLCPALLDVPEVHAGRQFPSTASSTRPLYWLAPQRSEVKYFFDQAIYNDPRLYDLVQPRLAAIADIVDVEFLKQASNDLKMRQLLFSFATVALWYQKVLASQSSFIAKG